MSNNIATVRQHLLDTLADLRNRDTPMEIDRARAVADVARVLVDSAKVEVDYLKVTNQSDSEFMAAQPEGNASALPSGITGIRRHIMK